MFEFIPHLIELRARLLRCLLVTGLILLPLGYYTQDIFHYFAKPFLTIPSTQHLIAIDITSPILGPLQLSIALSFLLSMPYWLLQIWYFIGPGLYRLEQQKFLPLCLCSSILFYLGVLFAQFVICPLTIRFCILNVPSDVTVMTDIMHYLNFLRTLWFSAGFAFQVPIVIVILLRSGIISYQQARQIRPYAVVVFFTLGMLLTPPDVISQVMLALPMCVLFELGIWYSQKTSKQNL